jgi:transcriptional antiterminator RfaH
VQADTTAWYLVHTKPRQEQLALDNLQRQGYECYFPQLTIEKIRRGKSALSLEAMFPRYLFIKLGTGDQSKSWSPIRSTLGVSGLVYFGTRAARVNEGFIEQLRLNEQATPSKALYQLGQPVVVTDGPFSGIEAIYQTSDAERRAMILLEILGKPVVMQIETARLRPSNP